MTKATIRVKDRIVIAVDGVSYSTEVDRIVRRGPYIEITADGPDPDDPIVIRIAWGAKKQSKQLGVEPCG